MSGRRRGIPALLLILAAALALAAPAAAEFGPIQLVSRGVAQQADFAIAPAISADGHYLAFRGRLGAWEGVFREDLRGGAIVRVATASPSTPGVSAKDASAPSISADGRYVSFTTAAPLDPDDDSAEASSDVYVADMASSPPSYELASALDGCDPGQTAPHPACGLTYASVAGSEATGRAALSADGRKVVFVTAAESNLTSEPGGSTEGVPTPAGQVVLRDLDSDRTTLVSAERDPETGAMTKRPVPGGALLANRELSLLRGASLSADGTTVAWIGTHLSAQVGMPAAEASAIDALDAGAFPYDEPLWRRLGDGPGAPIRRIVAGDGAADPFPGMTAKSTDLNFAQGWLGAKRINGVPRLSADGMTVALIGNPTEASNLFVVDMTPGLSRARAVRQLTREIVVNPENPAQAVNHPPYIPLNGDIFDLAISADGRRIAFTSGRQRFPLAPPNLIGTPPSGLGLVELFVIDRDSEALRRVTHGLADLGEPSLNARAQTVTGIGAPVEEGEGAGAPSFDGGGGTIAFSSPAFNLVNGDGNDASDAFLVDDHEVPRVPRATTISPPPGSARRHKKWRLTLSARSLADGSVRIVAGVPAPGRLRAKVGPEPGGGPRARQLAGARLRAPRSGRIVIPLRLPARLRPLAHTREGVYAMARVSFHPRRHKTLHGRIQIRFRAQPKSRAGGGR